MLKGLTALVTSGPTHEPIDPVRYLANYSSGKQGHAIAEALRDAGANVTLVHGPTALKVPDQVKGISVVTALEMLEACQQNLPVDIAICAAAVCDWRPAKIASSKIKKQSNQTNINLELVANPDILAFIGKHQTMRPRCVIGFAAESTDLYSNSIIKLKNKGADAIIGNLVDETNEPFGNDSNRVSWIDLYGHEEWTLMSKQNIAIKIVEKISRIFGNHERFNTEA